MRAQASQAGLFTKPSKLFTPGSAPWLMRHHVRTRLRGRQTGSTVQKWGRNLTLLLIFAGAIMTVGKSVADALATLDGDYNHGPFLLKAGLMMSAFIISLLGSSLISAYALFTDRDDLDLLLASPLPPQRILMARMLQSAYGAFFSAMAMGTVAFGYAIVTVNAQLALIYPVLFSIMVINLAIGFAVARGFLIWFGLRRGRFLSMVLGFAVLIGGVLMFQVNASLGSLSGERILQGMFGSDVRANLTALVSPIGRLVFGLPLETFALVLAAMVIFCGVGAFFWNRFAGDAAMLAGQTQEPNNVKSSSKLRFRQGLLITTILKEWRGMLRDPYVLVQVATPLVTLIPVGISLWMLQRPGSNLTTDFITPMIGFLVVMFGGQIAGTLAWTAASIEEGGDLLLSSPSDGGVLFWSKALATAIPSALFLTFAMALIGLTNTKAAFAGFVLGGVGLICCGAIEFLRPRPARRVKMTQRPDRAATSVLLGAVFSMIWASATAMAMAEMELWTLIPVVIGVLALAFVWATSPKSVAWLAKAPKVGAAGGPWKA